MSRALHGTRRRLPHSSEFVRPARRTFGKLFCSEIPQDVLKSDFGARRLSVLQSIDRNRFVDAPEIYPARLNRSRLRRTGLRASRKLCA